MHDEDQPTRIPNTGGVGIPDGTIVHGYATLSAYRASREIVHLISTGNLDPSAGSRMLEDLKTDYIAGTTPNPDELRGEHGGGGEPMSSQLQTDMTSPERRFVHIDNVALYDIVRHVATVLSATLLQHRHAPDADEDRGYWAARRRLVKEQVRALPYRDRSELIAQYDLWHLELDALDEATDP